MNKENLLSNLIAIYGILLTLCIAIYALMTITDIDKSAISNLLVWSATLFATIAILYTYDNWRHQKGSEVISNESILIVNNLNNLEEVAIKLATSFNSSNLFSNNLEYFIKEINSNTSKLSLINTLIKAKNKGDEDSYLTDLICKYTQSSSQLCIKLTSISYKLNKIKSFTEILEISEEYSKKSSNLKAYIALYALYQK